MNYTHRVSQGLTLLASYTFSKFIDNVGGPESWAYASANFSENIRNVYNLAAEKSVDATDTPNSFVLSYVYELPVGKGKKFGFWDERSREPDPRWLADLRDLYLQTGLSSDHWQQEQSTISERANMWMSWATITSRILAAPSGSTPRLSRPPALDPGGCSTILLRSARTHYKNWDISIQKYFPIQERSDSSSAWICSTRSTTPTSTARTPRWGLDLEPLLKLGRRGSCRQR